MMLAVWWMIYKVDKSKGDTKSTGTFEQCVIISKNHGTQVDKSPSIKDMQSVIYKENGLFVTE